MADAMKIPGFVAAYLRPLFLEGGGRSGGRAQAARSSDLVRLDDLVMELFGDDDIPARWIRLAREHVPIEGLPARVCYLGFGQRKRFGLAVNELIRRGEVQGPVAFSRDNLDSGSIINPTFETENMPDGSDVISDWPYLNGLLNASAMCDLIAIQANYAMGESVHTGVTMIADGCEEADLRLEAALTVDSGIGVVRHAQSGYERAREVAEEVGPGEGLSVPLWWTREATFGPERVATDERARADPGRLRAAHLRRGGARHDRARVPGGSVLIEGRTIVAAGMLGEVAADTVIDAGGAW